MDGIDCSDVQRRCGLVVEERVGVGNGKQREERREEDGGEHLAIFNLASMKESEESKGDT